VPLGGPSGDRRLAEGAHVAAKAPARSGRCERESEVGCVSVNGVSDLREPAARLSFFRAAPGERPSRTSEIAQV
jgi:hypothetical protein